MENSEPFLFSWNWNSQLCSMGAGASSARDTGGTTSGQLATSDTPRVHTRRGGSPPQRSQRRDDGMYVNVY